MSGASGGIFADPASIPCRGRSTLAKIAVGRKRPPSMSPNSSLWRLSKYALKTPSGCTFRVRLKDVRPNNVLRGYTNGYVQLAGSRRGRPTFAIVTLCSAEEPGLSLEER